MKEIQDLKQEILQIKSDQKDIKNDIRSLESRTLGNEKDIININKQLDKISANTTWILRIIIGAIVAGLLGLLMKGGM
ncbi:hemolysin XhlA family protein [Bacillus sp. FSL L8-0199]|uniref:hemolysin XhlA family protein n=1 Tax=Bacillus sp. FSL L8-0199 TaxID=2954616 RepID=UPI0030F7275A